MCTESRALSNALHLRTHQMFKLRPYQQHLVDENRRLWSEGVRNPCSVLFTGGGKTVVAAELIRQEQQSGGYFAAIAHRQELVGQISLALARQGVMHDIVAPRPVIRFCSNIHVEELGQSFYSPHAPGFVGGVDTLVRRDMGRLKNTVSLLFQDECHHVLRDNKWGKATQMFPQANGLYVTATPLRADGKGLGRHSDGLFDEFVLGPPPRQLISEGSLTDYKIYAPPTDIDLTAMKFGSDGDFSRPELVKRAKKSGIIGDCVTNYQKYANGTQAVVFTVDVEQAHDAANEFNARGIKAVALSAKNTDAERQEAITAFKRKDIQVIVNVDLLGEGFDCPAIETVIMARPTASYGLYVQQFGRALRLLDGKHFGLIIDMVGNVKRHGLPDAPREWSLDRREKRGKSDAGAPAVKTCSECMGVYAVGPTSCPYCGHVAIAGAGGRGELVMVDAELRELTAEELADMRGEADKLTKEWNVPYGGSKTQIMAAISHNKTVGAQRELRDAVALYAGAFRAMGVPDQMIHVQLWQRFGTNTNALQTLRPKDANELKERILKDLKDLGVAV
ncbi:DNA helicase [Vibrio phage 234P10]